MFAYTNSTAISLLWRRPIIKSGEKVPIMPVHEHKPAKQFLDRIVLRPYLQSFIEMYILKICLIIG